MTSPTRYAAGCDYDLPYSVRVELNALAGDPGRSDLLARWIEFWCQANCDSTWRLLELDRYIDVGFADQGEAALFKLSPEYNNYN